MTDHSIFVLLYYISAVVMFLCCTILTTHETSRMQKLALLTTFCLLVSCLGYIFRIEADCAHTYIAGQKLNYSAVITGMYIMLLFIFEYCGYKINNILKWALHGINGLVAVAVFTMDYHKLFYVEYWAIDRGLGYIDLQKEYGPLHTVAVAMFGVYMLIAVITTVVYSVNHMKDKRRNALRLLVAVSIPCICYIAERVLDLENDLQPISFAAFGIIVTGMIYKRNLYDVDNIAYKYFRTTLSHGVIVLDEKNRFKGANPRAREIFPALANLIIDGDALKPIPQLEKWLNGSRDDYIRDGECYSVSLRNITEAGKTVGHVLWFEDVTVERRLTKLLESQNATLENRVSTLSDISYKDELTGICNRRCFEEKLAELRWKDTRGLTVCAMDINGLKEMNDTKGHSAGDELIRGTAEVITGVFSRLGSVYRTGGDEFFAIMENESADTAALGKALEQGLAGWKGRYVDGISLSYGFARAEDEPGKTADELMILADRAMYRMKREYHGQIKADM